MIFSKVFGASDRDTRQAAIILDRNSAIDNDEVEELKKKRTRYLLFALQNYSNALAIGNKHNNKVFRLISLW